ncbi:MAG: alpha/beta fold hydrolase, partial [Pseudomonadota bacterium]
QLLPPDVPVHLVTHSRGGLVGELLCASSLAANTRQRIFEADDIQLFPRQEDREAFEALNRHFEEGAPAIERYIRVACPSRGTTLMDGRTDLWLSTVVNVAKQSAKVIGKSLGIPTGGIAGDLADVANISADILVAAAKLRADPMTLPGLEAMLTSSPTVRLLNTFPRIDARLTVIAGTFEGSGVLGTIAKFVSDRFYGEPHDLVVPTASMKRGITRQRGLFLDVADVKHSEYFVHPKSVDALVDALTATGKTHFKPLPPPRRGAITHEPAPPMPRGARAALEARPTLYVLPGVLGSNLSIGDDRIWLDLLDLARGRFEALAIGEEDIRATSLHAGAYGSFLNAAREHFTVRPHAYDWRRSLKDLGEALASAVQKTLETSEQPVYLIAHSMGGLVARAMMVQHPELWERIVARGGRLLMAGTPNAGSYATVRALLGKNRLINLLAIVDRRNDREALLAVLKAFPGFLQLLPQIGSEPDQTADHFAAAPWQRYRKLLPTGWCVPSADELKQAANTLDDIVGQPLEHAEHVLYVAGVARQTPAGINADGDEIVIVGSRRGDGTVLWDGGIPAGVKAWYVRAQHGDLLDRKRYFRAYFDLLTRGTTQELPSAPPLAREQDRREPIEDANAPQHFPDETEVFDEYLGGAAPATDQPPVKVRVVHGDLRWSTHPVLIGHYVDDGIYNAEQALDETLDYRLSQRLALDDYPGPVGTAAVFLNSDGDAGRTAHQGAVVVGLGVVGDIQPAALTVALARGMRSYAARSSELQPEKAVEGLSLTALLVASGEGGVGAQDSLRALLTALD